MENTPKIFHFGFIKWYSGMKDEQIEKAWQRYQTESPLPVSAPEKKEKLKSPSDFNQEAKDYADGTGAVTKDYMNTREWQIAYDAYRAALYVHQVSPPSTPRKTLEECMCEILKIKDTELSSYLSINVVDVKNISRLFANQQGNGWIEEYKYRRLKDANDLLMGYISLHYPPKESLEELVENLKKLTS